MKTLRVCLASELPVESDRSPDYLYFAYDKLYLFSGQNYLEDNFVITEEIPEDQVYGMMYILNTDGSVHRMIDYEDTVIAEIEDPAQIEILKKAGTMFYVNARHRYIDSQRRVLTLPFNDGTYELNVSTQKDTVYDENTILKYNPETNRFEVYSDTAEDFIDYSKPFRGATTNSAIINVNGPRVSGQVRLSKNENNILRAASDGLYVPLGEYVSKEEFDKWSSTVLDLKSRCEDVLNNIAKEVADMTEFISPEYILSVVMNTLEGEYPNIQEALDNYDTYVAQLDSLENQIVNYADMITIGTRNTLIQKINDYQTLQDLDDCSNYRNEVNYYEKYKEWLDPSMRLITKKILLAAALAALNNDMEE